VAWVKAMPGVCLPVLAQQSVTVCRSNCQNFNVLVYQYLKVEKMTGIVCFGKRKMNYRSQGKKNWPLKQKSCRLCLFKKSF
jgi:hypothetical protein